MLERRVSEVFESLDDEIYRLRMEKAQADQAATAFQEQADVYKRQLDEYRAGESKAIRQARANRERADELEKEVILLRESNQLASNRIESLELTVKHADQAAMVRASQRIRELENQTAELTVALTKATGTLGQVKGELKTLQTKRDSRLTTLEENCASYKQQIVQLSKELKRKPETQIIEKIVRLDAVTRLPLSESASVEDAIHRRAALSKRCYEIDAELTAWGKEYSPELRASRLEAKAAILAELGYLKSWIKQRNIEASAADNSEQLKAARALLWMFMDGNTGADSEFGQRLSDFAATYGLTSPGEKE